MRNIRKILTAAVLTFCLIFPAVTPAYAQKTNQSKELHISTVEEFKTFAEKCRFDKYSRNLNVSLDADIDLSDEKFESIPIFSGTFNGNDHVISGIEVKNHGSFQGLFRYITSGAEVRDLGVKAEILPKGTKENLGGIAGCNEGLIFNCTFDGKVSGNDKVGGIAGTNAVSGIIEKCTSKGNIHGNHFVGGITGENFGLVRSSANKASVNITSKQNSVDLSDITISNVAKTESANTVTDIGGVAGTNTGVIRKCTNSGTVGYKHMGYNVGGIAGSQKGYITQCKNRGSIYGRKEVGGITGQMEPISKIEYTADTLQILQQQVEDASALASQASLNAQNSADAINGEISSLENQSGIAKDAIEQLVPNKDNPHLPDKDSLLAAKNTLNSSMTSMNDSINNISSSLQDATATLASDIQALTNQMGAISDTVNSASENLGARVTDVSDSDTSDDLTGKTEKSENHGTINADLNAGGIVGAISFENDLDHENDYQVIGNRSMNSDSELRSVILKCKNTGTVDIKKKCAGGIVGRMTMGLAKDCINTGEISREDSQYTGGIAGTSSGYIRSCDSKCRISSQKLAGGIAGSAAVVTDCRSIAEINDCDEKFGAVLGFADDTGKDIEDPIKGNYYLLTGDDMGGIDGISYSGKASPVKLKNFLALEDMPEEFLENTVVFNLDKENQITLTVPLGDKLDTSKIPEIPDKDDCTGSWEGIKDTDLNHVYFDMSFEPSYTSHLSAVKSKDERADGKAVLLAEGTFPTPEDFELIESDDKPKVKNGDTILECWKIPKISDSAPTALHYICPEGQDFETAKIMVKGKDGWSKKEFTVDESYLVFDVSASDTDFCLIKTKAPLPIKKIILGGILLVLVIGILVFSKRKKKNIKKAKEEN